MMSEEFEDSSSKRHCGESTALSETHRETTNHHVPAPGIAEIAKADDSSMDDNVPLLSIIAPSQISQPQHAPQALAPTAFAPAPTTPTPQTPAPQTPTPVSQPTTPAATQPAASPATQGATSSQSEKRRKKEFRSHDVSRTNDYLAASSIAVLAVKP